MSLISLRILQAADKDAYQPLTFRHLIPELQAANQEPGIIAIGATYLNLPAGLILAKLHQAAKHAEISSFYVKSDCRRLGIGTALFQKLEELAAEQGCEIIKANYFGGKQITPIVEAFLAKCDWSEPQLQSLIHTTNIEKMTQAPWLRSIRLPRHMSPFLWSELTPSEREQLILEREQNRYPVFVSPLQYEHRIEPLNSLGIRAEGKLVGWVIVHRSAADTLLYNSVYVEPQYRQLGIAFILLTKAIELQIEAGINYGMFTVNLHTKDMLKIVERWFKPYMIKTTEMRAVFKHLI